MLATEVVKQCGIGSGKSGKVQIVQGELTAAASVDQVGGIMEVLNKDSNIKVRCPLVRYPLTRFAPDDAYASPGANRSLPAGAPAGER
jgi:hypothetical protein